MSSNYLRMNDDKTVVMEIHSPYSSTLPIDKFNLDDCDIIPTDSAKNLGYWFDKHLSLDTQIKNVSKKCYQNLRKIGRIGSKLTKNLKIQLVHASIHSIIDFCNGTYFALTKIQLGKLQKIQNAAVRLIQNLRGKERFQPITPFLKDLHFLPVIYRIKFKIALLTYKCINNIAPPYLSCLLKMRKPSCHMVRADNDFFMLQELPEPRCAKTKGAFSYCAPKVWNSLPYSLRCMSEVESFKCALKTYLFKSAFADEQSINTNNISDMLDYET